MRGEIYKVDPLKESANKGQSFYRLYFKLESGAWAATDVVPAFRNFRRWKPILDQSVPIKVDGLTLKGPEKVDADSLVKLI